MRSAWPRNGPGDLALVMGIVAVVFSVVPIVGEFVAAPAAVAAVVSGAVGAARCDRGVATNAVSAWSGIVLGVVAASITLLVFVATRAMG